MKEKDGRVAKATRLSESRTITSVSGDTTNT